MDRMEKNLFFFFLGSMVLAALSQTLPPPPPFNKITVKDSNNVTCLMAQNRAQFQIPYTKKDGSEGIAFLQIADVISDGSSCGNETATIQARFGQNYISEDYSQVTHMAKKWFAINQLNLSYYLDEKTFPDARNQGGTNFSYTTFNAPIAPIGNSFECTFQAVGGLDGDITMYLDNNTLQVFGEFPDGNFGPAVRCSNDDTTTVSSTPKTTPKVTTSTPAKRGQWRVEDGGANSSACILFYAALQITINYVKKTDTTPGVAEYDVPTDAVAMGVCTPPSITLQYRGEETFSVTFADRENSSWMDKVTIVYNISDPDRFPDAKDTGLQTLEFDVKEKLSSNVHAYICDAARKFESTAPKNGGFLTMSEAEIQAVNVNDSKFSDGEHCAADAATTGSTGSTAHVSTDTTASGATATTAPKTTNTGNLTTTPRPTTQPTTPTIPTNPPPPNPVKDKFVVTDDNKTCLILETTMQFKIPYEKKVADGKVEMVIQEVNLPQQNETEIDQSLTKCGNDTSTIAISFFKTQMDALEAENSWWVALEFSKDKDVSGDPNKFVLDKITLFYIEDEVHFKNTANPGKVHTVTKDKLKLFSASVGKSYMCKDQQVIDLGNDYTLLTTEFRAEPFVKRSDNSPDFNDPEECSADDNTSDIVPIAVGAALAALVIIVLVAYLIGRRRSNKGYQTV